MGILVSLHFLVGTGLTPSPFLLHACRWVFLIVSLRFSKLSQQAILTDSIKSFTKINKTSVQALFWNFDIYMHVFRIKIQSGVL